VTQKRNLDVRSSHSILVLLNLLLLRELFVAWPYHFLDIAVHAFSFEAPAFLANHLKVSVVDDVNDVSFLPLLVHKLVSLESL